MKRVLAIIISIAVWTAIIFYVVWSAKLGKEKRAQVTVQNLIVDISDSAQVDIIKASMVEEWIGKANLNPTGKNIDEVDARAISGLIESRDFVKSAKTYIDLNGNATVSVTQRYPVMRVITGTGYDFYFTRDGYIIPTARYSAHYVPVITGDFGLPFDRKFNGNLDIHIEEIEKKSDENYIFLTKLINFVNYIGDSEFWNSQIVQINVLTPSGSGQRFAKEPEIELVPRVGDHVILLGGLNGYEGKLDKLLKFYNDVLNREGWNNWNYINLKYDGQVVCSNR